MTIYKGKSWILVILAASFSMSGCATALTSAKISPGEEKQYDYVADVTAAYRDIAGNVVICVTGMPAGANYWIPGNRNYTLNFPASSSPNLEVFYHKTIPRYQVTMADVKNTCPEKQEGLMALPVLTVHARDFGNEDYSGMSDEALKEFFRTRAKAPAIYTFFYKAGWVSGPSEFFNIVYVSEKPIHGKANAVEIATGFRKVKGEPGYVLLVPFAVLFDIVTFPIQLLFALTYH
jgi:uncharacterized protein YceK